VNKNEAEKKRDPKSEKRFSKGEAINNATNKDSNNKKAK
jgi:hypothetical protein